MLMDYFSLKITLENKLHPVKIIFIQLSSKLFKKIVQQNPKRSKGVFSFCSALFIFVCIFGQNRMLWDLVGQCEKRKERVLIIEQRGFVVSVALNLPLQIDFIKKLAWIFGKAKTAVNLDLERVFLWLSFI